MKSLIGWIRTRLSRARTPMSAPEVDTSLLRAVNVSRSAVIARRVRWAGTGETRRRGLLHRDAIDRDEGLYIVPTQWIHMFGMRFPIDVVFLASNGRVLHIHHALKPNRLSRLVWRAEGALELAEGVLRESNTSVGDIIEFDDKDVKEAPHPVAK